MRLPFRELTHAEQEALRDAGKDPITKWFARIWIALFVYALIYNFVWLPLHPRGHQHSQDAYPFLNNPSGIQP